MILPLLMALSTLQERGKAIYLRGESPHPITATLAEGMAPIPAAIVPCANCHGEDGHGKPEGSVRPADITPESLARAHYTKPLLKRAFTMGIGADKRELNVAMPRYQMTQDDASALLAYLEIVGHEPQPGLTDDALRIKVVGDSGALPASPRIYGRQVSIVSEGEAFATIDASDDPSASIVAAERDHIPTIVVHSPTPVTSHYAFSLTATEADERAALAHFAPALLLTSREAKALDFATLPRDRRVLVAAPLPPTPQARHDAVAAAVTIVTNLLAQLGRDVTRSALADALEHIYHLDTHVLPPLTWSANRHHGTTSAWLMTVDEASGRLLAEPGWVEP